MGILTEAAQWVADIFKIETDTVWKGGDDGDANKQGQALANRTLWLKGQVEALGNDKQPLDATLTALSGLATVADRMIYSTGADTFALTPLSAFIRTLLDDADAATARATLGAISQAQLDAAIAALVNSSPGALDTLNELAMALGNDANFATTITNALALKAPLASPGLTGIPTVPTAAFGTDTTQIASTAFVQAAINSAVGVKIPVRAMTTGNIANLAGGAPNVSDGVSLNVGDRVFVPFQTTGSQNGLYVVTTLGTGSNGTWTRATDADGVGELFAGMLVVVSEGSAYADSIWELSTDGAITIGTTSLTFTRKDSSSGATVQGAFKNLQVSATGTNATVTVSADEIAVEDSSNAYKTLRTVSLSINSAGAGANGLDAGSLAALIWYSVWVIYNPTTQTTAGLLSLSLTAPTMPSGYTMKARVGWVRTDGTANKFPLSFKQYGRRVQYAPAAATNLTALPVMASGTPSGTYTAIGTGNYVPSTASAIKGTVNTSSTNGYAAAAPNSTFATSSGGTNPPPAATNAPGTGGGGCGFDFLLESSNIYWITNGTIAGSVTCLGWEDNI